MPPALQFHLQPATLGDAERVAKCVHAAYRHYEARLGQKPAPMLLDYAQVIRQRQVVVAQRNGIMAGMIVLGATNNGFHLDNVAVHPSCQGKGLGRQLLQFAETEALRQGYSSIGLYTHVQMTENQLLYAKQGYTEFDRRVEDGYARVYMRKQLR